MKLPARALAALALTAACKESRPPGVSSDVPIVLFDSGPRPDVPAIDAPPAPDTGVARDVAPGTDGGPPRDTGPLVVEAFRPIAPLSGAYARSLRPTFRWTALAGATSYRVEYATARGFMEVASTEASTTTSFTPTADLPRGLRWWRVVGVNGTATLRTTVAWPVTLGRAPHDLNGDGRADVVIGAAGRDSGNNTPTGEVYVHFGAATVPASPSVTLTASMPGERLGTAISTAGDVNGDGYADLLVGAGYFRDGDAGATSETGRAAIYLGGASMATSPSVRLAAPVPGAGFGRALAIVGDVNGDGYADWVVGAAAYDRLSGRAWLYYGGATPDAMPDLELTYAMPGDAFGTSVTGAGDLNGDGFADVAVGAPQTVGSSVGEVRVFYGGATPNNVVDANLVGAGTNLFGTAVAGAGDFNGDGFADLAVGSPSIGGAGAVAVFAGAAGALNQRLLDVPGAVVAGAGEKLGGALDSAGDVNNDGFGDLVVGAESNAANGATTGRAYLFTGGAPPAAAAAVAFSSADTSGGNVRLLGHRVAGAGDVDGDGFDDVLVRAGRAPANVGREGGPGAVFMYRGGAAPAAAPAWTSVGVGDSQVNEYGVGLAFRASFRPRYF
ncbi:MAG: putative integrin-like protein [Myxococcaceae bacterium]|nr:putative integrin-like protein [Myxococcaceae bacterium]